MSLAALLFALFCERGLTHLLHLREGRWLDPVFDRADRMLGGRTGPVAFAGAVALVLLPTVPVALAWVALGPHLLGLPQFAFAVFVLLFSFGPRDLKEEVDDYVDALERHDRDEALRRGKELLESSPASQAGPVRNAVEEAIFVQANNRIFGIVFWFVVLGAAGAWAYRVSDLLRRRAAFEAARQGLPRARGDLGDWLNTIHGVLAWLPARLAALSYAVAGSFEDGVGNWRLAVDRASSGVLDRAESLLARVGSASLKPSLAGLDTTELDVATARGSWRIVARGLSIWIAVISLLVIRGAIA